ncbi:ComF family protein [Saccharicrinis fermentans]|uniref:DNA utilization protein GntX n=1 Tax=Saccharicrinis fermentans DSM 9555 = JCM 21142 TaxID=869213 RepID=W7YBN6_9BACT|nr:phosphoribosyltransferase family protein [Saccharicrinis fermentans]GAF01851.1 DNA utilization protein GntX [Saccharicrinis fermentans DSM 9555 = JCM 21142]
MNYISDFFQLFFPRTCPICHLALFKHEKSICTKCLRKLPRTYFHLAKHNPLDSIFWGRVDIEKVASFLLYTKGSMVKYILHSLKYKNQKELGYELGKLYGHELAKVNYFGPMDYLLPIPLHPKKLAQRGYNQSEWIARGLAEHMSAQLMIDNLYKCTFTSSQTNKGRYRRWENISNSFDIRKPSLLENKRVLLVDDVLTTGATIEACAAQLTNIKGVSVSVATLAYATTQ